MWNRILKGFYQDGFLTACIGLVLGALLNYFWILIIVLLFIVFRLASGIWSEVKFQRLSHRKAQRFIELRNPDNDTIKFAEKFGHKEVIVGKVIEIWSHKSLDTMLNIYDLGVDPRLVHFSLPTPKYFSDTLSRCGGLRHFPPPNQKKYGINKLPLGIMDDENLIVDFHETNWDTWMSVRTTIENNVALRHELSHVNPNENKLPQSMSLQFLVRFINGDILVLKRKEGLASEPTAWSCSAEEQLHENDFRCQNTSIAEYLFRRAFIEEVLGHRGEDEQFIHRIWTEDCDKLVHTHRIWSFFLEEGTGIFQMFGLYQLRIQPVDLRKIHELAASSGWGTTDPEGSWYVLYANDIEKFLTDNECLVHRLHGDAEHRIMKSEDIHATSRYRLWRLYTALNRKYNTMSNMKLS